MIVDPTDPHPPSTPNGMPLAPPAPPCRRGLSATRLVSIESDFVVDHLQTPCPHPLPQI